MSQVDQAMRKAFQAILRGDYAERDRLLAKVRRGIQVEEIAEVAAATARVMKRADFYVSKAGVAIPIQAIARAAGVID